MYCKSVYLNSVTFFMGNTFLQSILNIFQFSLIIKERISLITVKLNFCVLHKIFKLFLSRFNNFFYIIMPKVFYYLTNQAHFFFFSWMCKLLMIMISIHLKISVSSWILNIFHEEKKVENVSIFWLYRF